MAKGLINDSTLTAIADAIRAKVKTADTMRPSEMAALIKGISGGTVLSGAVQLGTSITNVLPLGVALPETDNYMLLISLSKGYAPDSTGFVIHMAGVHYGSDGWMKDMYVGKNATDDCKIGFGTGNSILINHATGDITYDGTHTGVNFRTRTDVYYQWMYIAF